MRTYILPVAFVHLFIFVSCVDYEFDEPQQKAWDLSSIEEVGQLPGASVGRLWISPNPVVFGVDQGGYQIQMMGVDIANIGSEKVVIDKITISGDPDFDFQEAPEEDRFPHEINGRMDCNGHSGMGFALVYADITDNDAQANMTVHTSDPTSPTVSVPVYMKDTAIYDSYYDMATDEPKPVVKPNPIRIDREDVSGEYKTEVCLVTHGGGDQRLRFTNVEAFGDSFSVEEVRDYQGNEVTIPLPDEQWTADPSTAVISYNPEQDKAEDGALVVRFERDSGRQQTLVIPIIVR